VNDNKGYKNITAEFLRISRRLLTMMRNKPERGQDNIDKTGNN
jgi:hypothetical protein